MNLLSVTIALLLLCFLNTYISATHNPTYFTDDISINSGSIGASSALNGREWVGDVKPKYPALLQLKGSSTTSTAIHKLMISADPIPHKTARISLSQFSYAFHVSPGQKIIRLHFNPATYRGFRGLRDLFTVEAGPFTLLSNFSASLTAHALGLNSFAKEFCLNIQENEQLILTFSPATSPSLDTTTYAFINGIEIISVPPGLSYFEGGDTGVLVVGQMSLVHVDHNTALEIVHRLSIKPNPVLSTGDFDGVFPTWAKKKANKSRNDTWKVPIDVGFRYLIRLHFSEVGLKIARTGDGVFKVVINEIIAQTNIDIVKESDENSIPRYRDYMVMIKGHKREGKRDILISVMSYDELIDGSVLIAGFEVFKLSNPDNNLASPNPLPPEQDSPSWIIQTLLSVLGRTNAMATFAVTIIALVNIIVHKLREIWEAGSSEVKNMPSARAERLCRRFSLAEIRLATRNFSDALFIGRGGFGKVYKGLIDKGQTTVAVKRLKSNSWQGAHEFLMEIETLSELRHANIVSLIGYCKENEEMILVYDYMAGGTLADHLYKLQRESNDCTSLTWKQRLNICIGAGRGLDYLHTGHGVIHRDVKASNILLDENLVAKVSDFGLAKHENRSTSQSHISTKVKGTKGYLDAHYMTTGKLTRKSDTYAIGVVLLEVLCGRPAVDLMLPEDEQILTKWARENISKGKVDEIVASSLRGEISEGGLKAFVEVAERCLLDEPKKRPTMAQVVLQLEFALEQQESKQLLVLNEISSVSDDIRPCNDETDLSPITGQLTVASIDVQNLTPRTKEQANSKAFSAGFPSGRKDGRKAKTYKPLRLWQWDTFWNRVKPSKKKELLLESYEEICDENIKLAKFDWNTVAAATNQFSSSQLIGQDRYGPVYKAVLPTGQVVAVKRHSPTSVLSLKEFNTEIFFLPNIMHRNIIKLLGYCTHRKENLLVYEFMQNGSLDTFIDGGQRHRLQWPVRFNIIIGIAQGLLYLHQDSGLRIIHRDIKTSNILLDTEMNPKVSNFAFARTLADNQSELGTARVVGTYGYMSPEYAIHGKCSFKSDVYSFGITVLEIVSGRRNQQHTPYQESHVLPDYAWKLWNEGKAVDLVDKSLVGAAFPVEEALRCIQVGLLCIQFEPNHRPETYSVLKMLQGEKPIPEPQHPPPRASLLHHEAMLLMQHSNSMTHLNNEACEETCEPNIKLANFDWDTIAAATKEFSYSNKVGQGGFGSVYKGVLPTGQVVAVKRHSPNSLQGLKELNNEILLLPKLQHRNIVKLLGYCIHRDEKLLVYEFMENKSLDAYRDEVQRQHLQWPLRFSIIMGIARGLLYLHRDSGLRIIHRGIKTSNILLDADMNPKISDFDFARTLAEHQTESDSTRIVGTMGYIPPEYCRDGIFSFKSDVYSFGITVLEIVSGRRNHWYPPNHMVLLHYAWMLWNEGKAVDLVDESLGGAFPVEEALRCIQVGLLCTQDEPYHRPEMHSVIKMLEGEELVVEPQPPARFVYDDAASVSDATFEYDDTLQR
ncbi:Receptor-like protein kinase FERONIA [Sesamum alatum]|uniref:non-specific serine/threonine protein kinase n=1 Tax=Sesamum alatum TaxID=300844 RepID=A0AAE1XT74_9LAMI|nr:Receptor-like protein kinase FERONIA [Sesamum alatum]